MSFRADYRIGKVFALLLAAVATISMLPTRASAAVTELALWKLGEPGSFVGGFPQDAVGGHNFLNNFGTQSVITPGAPLPSSTAANSYTAIAGSYDTDAGTTVFPTDNFVLELWARTANKNQAFTDLFTTGNGAGSLRIHSDPSGNWAASLSNVAWIGAANGAGQPATNNKWTNLAVIRSNGVSTFYIDGVAQPGTFGGVPVVDYSRFHVGVMPGGSTGFTGALDEVRIYSFDPNTDNPVSALSIVSRGLYATNGDFEGTGQTTTGDGSQDILGWFDSGPQFSSWEFGRPGAGGSDEAGTLNTDGWMYQSLGTYFAENGTILKWSADAVNSNTGNGAGDPFEIDFYAGLFPGAAENVDIAGQGLMLLGSSSFSDSGTNVAYDIKTAMGMLDLSALPDGTEVWVRINGGNFDGVDNFVVSQTNPVPEPATATLALLGLGVLLRRRRAA